MTSSRLRHGVAALIVLAASVLASCAETSTAAAPEAPEPAHVEAVDDTGLHRITLEEQAVARLGLQTGAVETGPVDGQERVLVPHSAVVYDPAGTAWAYTVTDERTYERAMLQIDRVVGEHAVLVSGPPVGTEVVTVGAAELYGAEHDVGH